MELEEMKRTEEENKGKEDRKDEASLKATCLACLEKKKVGSGYADLNIQAEETYSEAFRPFDPAITTKDLQRRVRIYRGLCVILSVLSLILLIVVGVLGTARQSQTMCHDEKAIPGVMKQDPKFLSASCSPQECRQVCRVKGYLASPRKYCDFGWQEFEGTCFYISRDMCTWAKGREECRNMDGDLAVVTNQRLQEFLIKKGNLAYWIGVIQTKTGETVWVNATVAQSYWGQSQLEGRCGYLIGGDNPAGTWHLSPCSYQTAYICQK